MDSKARPVLTRFAPSPSGPLHLGHGFSAVIAHDAARAAGGQFRLRIDDIDGTRSREEFVASAMADLHWLGLAWDGAPWRQSDHLADYAAALDRLIARGFAYPCFCTRADIAASASAPHGPVGPVYPGTCRALTQAEQAAAMATHPFCWRLAMDRAAAEAGPLAAVNNGAERAFDARPHGDVVIARKDAPASYHLASTLDDAAMGVTLVVRGADLTEATAVQLLLQRLLALPTPEYHHHALVVGGDGKRLAKRDAAAAIADLRARAIDGRQLARDLRVGRLPAGYSLAEA